MFIFWFLCLGLTSSGIGTETERGVQGWLCLDLFTSSQNIINVLKYFGSLCKNSNFMLIFFISTNSNQFSDYLYICPVQIQDAIRF